MVALGPLTNLARVERAQPGALRRLKRLLVMGGALTCPGNVTPLAEFNFYADPMAAQEVMGAAGQVDLFGLDVTSKAVMDADWIESLSTGGGECARMARQMLSAYAAMDPLLHDACPVAHLLHPGLFRGRWWGVAVDAALGASEGRSYGAEVATAPLANCMAYFEVDRQALLEVVRQSLIRLP